MSSMTKLLQQVCSVKSKHATANDIILNAWLEEGKFNGKGGIKPYSIAFRQVQGTFMWHHGPQLQINDDCFSVTVLSEFTIHVPCRPLLF